MVAAILSIFNPVWLVHFVMEVTLKHLTFEKDKCLDWKLFHVKTFLLQLTVTVGQTNSSIS